MYGKKTKTTVALIYTNCDSFVEVTSLRVDILLSCKKEFLQKLKRYIYD